MRRAQGLLIFECVFAAMAFAAMPSHAQVVDVAAKVLVLQKASPDPGRHRASLTSANVVVWLSPLQPDPAHPASTGHPGPFRLVQKDKQFTPHLLVVPVGSSVEFPNEDPFFHNVFSLFNGKRFDLGLYESGTSRFVHFDREGVSYIFCNIHPEMGAIVLALSTPFYGVSSPDGSIVIRDVPAGSYRLHIWSETAQAKEPLDGRKIVQVAAAPLNLGQIILESENSPMEHHKNKFGDDYPVTQKPAY
jgi:plastocyanin